MDKTEYYLELKRVFASEFAFYLKSANFHWNVEGSDFYEFHLLFERIYTEVYGVIDQFAEELRALQLQVPASFTQFLQLSYVLDQTVPGDSKAMVQELLMDSDTMALKFQQLFMVAEEAGDHGLSNFLADRQDAHKKHSWMLRASLK
jgi:starvation-inducible DNA-binding protein